MLERRCLDLYVGCGNTGKALFDAFFVLSDRHLTKPHHRYHLLMVFIPFQPVFTPNVAVFRSKILATPIYCAKNFGGVFFDIFRESEQKSEKIMTVDTLFAETPN